MDKKIINIFRNLSIIIICNSFIVGILIYFTNLSLIDSLVTMVIFMFMVMLSPFMAKPLQMTESYFVNIFNK